MWKTNIERKVVRKARFNELVLVSIPLIIFVYVFHEFAISRTTAFSLTVFSCPIWTESPNNYFNRSFWVSLLLLTRTHSRYLPHVIGEIIRPEVRSLLGQASWGNLQLGYRSQDVIVWSLLWTLRIRILLKVPSRRIFPRRFLPKVTATERLPTSMSSRSLIAKCRQLANRFYGRFLNISWKTIKSPEASCKAVNGDSGKPINTESSWVFWTSLGGLCPLCSPPSWICISKVALLRCGLKRTRDADIFTTFGGAQGPLTTSNQ